MNIKRVITVFGVLLVTNKIANFYMTKYETDSKHLEVKKGIIRKNRYRIKYDEIDKYTFDKSLIDFILGTKTVYIHKNDPIESEYKFKFVPDSVRSEIVENN